MEKEDIQKLKKENESLKKEIERLRSIRDKQKQGMVQKASEGNVMSRAPFGYNINKGKLIPAQNSEEIREIFEEFLDNKISLLILLWILDKLILLILFYFFS